MISLEQAAKAKAALRAQLGRPEWLRGVGIGVQGDDHCLRVNVAALTEEVSTALPGEVEGVPVHIEVVGEILPR
ncbi:hypothetical protein [Polyangium mundeleinium]|uniref:MIP18 family-like domain-containing protein n=1 Tax=Polyangium mundeleinium TaxID=2995306 RepID=A0ABT5EXM5_9BACT|nr:hypothetical protein [Polyangium mundeleinium]MDC0746548.1 hypothetical protein [Polyangium mundeleinium]